MVDDYLLGSRQFLLFAEMLKDEQVINEFEVFDKGVIQLGLWRSLYHVYCDMKQEIGQCVSLR